MKNCGNDVPSCFLCHPRKCSFPLVLRENKIRFLHNLSSVQFRSSSEQTYIKVKTLTHDDAERPECQRFRLGPKQRRLQHADGDDHRVGGLVVIRVDRGDVGHVSEVVPPASGIRFEIFLRLELSQEGSVSDDVGQVVEVVDVHLLEDRIDPRRIEHELRVADEVDHRL